MQKSLFCEKCQLCGGKNITQIKTKIRNLHNSETKVYECHRCEVQFLHPYYNESQLKHYYTKKYRKEYANESYYEKKNKKDYTNIQSFFTDSLPEAKSRVERIRKLLKKTDRILEIGCAAGYFLSVISKFAREVYGTKWDPDYSAYAKNTGLRIRENPTDFNKTFDKIFMFHVLEHIGKPIPFLRSLKSIMNKKALLFIEVPNREDALLKLYDFQKFRNFYYQSAHLWYFNHKSLRFVLDKAGFKYKIEYIQRYDLSNHIKWLVDRKPGGQGKFDSVFSRNLKDEYAKNLMDNGLSDTLFAIAKP